jgi:hypothetical protein
MRAGRMLGSAYTARASGHAASVVAWSATTASPAGAAADGGKRGPGPGAFGGIGGVGRGVEGGVGAAVPGDGGAGDGGAGDGGVCAGGSAGSALGVTGAEGAPDGAPVAAGGVAGVEGAWALAMGHASTTTKRMPIATSTCRMSLSPLPPGPGPRTVPRRDEIFDPASVTGWARAPSKQMEVRSVG